MAQTSCNGVLGYAYDHGQGVAQDEAEAVKWYRKAALLDDNFAKLTLKELGVSE